MERHLRFGVAHLVALRLIPVDSRYIVVLREGVRIKIVHENKISPVDLLILHRLFRKAVKLRIALRSAADRGCRGHVRNVFGNTHIGVSVPSSAQRDRADQHYHGKYQHKQQHRYIRVPRAVSRPTYRIAPTAPRTGCGAVFAVRIFSVLRAVPGIPTVCITAVSVPVLRISRVVVHVLPPVLRSIYTRDLRNTPPCACLGIRHGGVV